MKDMNRNIFKTYLIKYAAIQPYLTASLLKDHFHGCSVDTIFDYMHACIDTEVRYYCQYIVFIFGIPHTEY